MKQLSRNRRADTVREGRSSGKLVVWPLLLGIVGLFAASLAALAGAFVLTSNEADELADAHTAEQFVAALEQAAEDLAMRNLDWAWWDEAIDKFVISPDEIYANENLGIYAQEILGVSAALVAVPDGGLSFAFLDGARIPRPEHDEWAAVAAPLVRATRNSSAPDQPQPETGFVTVGSDIFLVSASAMALESGAPIVGWASRPAVLVFGRRLDDGFLRQMKRILGLESLELVPAEEAGRASIAITDTDGDSIGHLQWRLNYPGERIVATLWPTAAVIAVAMLVLVGMLMLWIASHTREYRLDRERRESELIEAEQRATAADRAKSLFLANTSHELRTPLNAVIGFAEALRLEYLGPLNVRQREYLAHIEDGGRHLLSVLHDVLDMARIEARREELEETDLCLSDIVSRAVVLVEPKRQNHELTVGRTDSATGFRLRADERRLLQMLLNILSNALSFSPPGSGVDVSIIAERSADLDTEEAGTAVETGGRDLPGLTISVRDHGPGIPDADMQHVFRPFHRPLDHSHDGNRESNGLGLPLTAMLMTLHGGKLELANAEDGGLRVSMRFPRSRTIAAANGGTKRHAPRLAASRPDEAVPAESAEQPVALSR